MAYLRPSTAIFILANFVFWSSVSQRFVRQVAKPTCLAPLLSANGFARLLRAIRTPNLTSIPVEVKGLEPMTLCLQSRCSPN